jgi:acetyl esterase/lipase
VVTIPFTLGTADRNLTYCNSQQLDLYIPRAARGHPAPIAVYIHGGGLSEGDKSNLNPVFLDNLASAGFAVASLNYRLAPDSRFPAQIEDVKCAIRFLRAKAQKYGLDGAQVFAFGTSAGGQLAAIAALTGHSVFDVGRYPAEPSNLLAAVDLFGPANLTESTSGYSPQDLQQILAKTDRQALLQASPIYYVVPHAPPILLVQGVDDPIVHASQSMELYQDLKSAGDPAQLLLVQNMGHMFMQVGSNPIDPRLPTIARDVVRFFDNARRS